MEPLDVARRAVESASDRQASDILLLDVRGLCAYADFFVLVSSDSVPQTEAIVRSMETDLADLGGHPLHIEGAPRSGWVLMDFSDVIVHIFSPEQRAHYNLEGLWRLATPLIRIQ
ncbi:MAG: ribosome silencing factor [Chloroflexi bacterium]|nr:ribosome silencing factor [Chloroflexota bacterium]